MKIEDLIKNKTMYNFFEISKIPRKSGHEKEISNFIYNWAINKGCKVYKDDFNNLIIKRKNNSSKDPIILQAHLDMVCEKTPDSKHNFLKDPIEWNVQGSFIKSKNGTTLGADCGIGVALIMTMLEENNDKFPPIEAILTTREETDMAGAYNIKKDLIKADRIINLDISPENKILVGSSGGFACEINFDVSFEEYNGQAFEINLLNMHGGHSGNDINKGYGNPLILINTLYKKIVKSGIDVRLISIDGGNSRLAIPREASLKFSSIDIQVEEKIKSIITNFLNFLTQKYGNSSKDIQLSYKKTNEMKVLSKKDELKFIELISLIPNGINDMDNRFNGLVESSSNLGVIRVTKNQVSLIEEVRCAYQESGEFILDKIKVLSKVYNFDINIHSNYPSWTSTEKSPLCESVIEIYKKLYKEKPIVTASHSGNELAILKDLLNLNDAIAIGPTRLYYHTPEEVLDYKSAIKFEEYLECILEKI